MSKENWRVNIIFLCVLILFSFIGYRLVILQVVNDQMWQALAQGQQTYFTTTEGARGEIYFQSKDGLIPAAVNKPGAFCFASPLKVENQKKTASSLSKVLDLKQSKILKKLKQGGQYAPLKHNLSEQQTVQIKELDLPGIYLRQEKVRVYPQQKFASHLLGFVGGQETGQYGIESYYNKQLKGKRGFLKGELGGRGNLIFAEESTFEQGSDLTLTVNYTIQYYAEELLQEAAEKYNIKSGSIVVMDPNTGKIFALANYPEFDPNKYFKQEFKTFKNSTIQNLYEPGSVFKPITLAAALNENVIAPHTTYVDQGKAEVGGYTINNYGNKKYGESTMTEVLEKSINTGAVFAEKKLGHEEFLKYLENFGIFEKTGIDLVGEVVSSNEELKRGRPANYATAAFGQGVAVTPIQLARAFSALINGGRLIQPHVVQKIGNKKLDFEKQRRVISRETSSQITTMMVSVVENGFASKAQLPGYYIGGKTGTAQIPYSVLEQEGSGYSNKTWQSFIGFAPAFNPDFLAVIKLEDPSTQSSGHSATPMFRKLTKFIMNYWEVPPTK